MAGSVVAPTGPRTAAVTPAFLYFLGHRLMTHGRAVAYLQLGDNGDVQLHPVSTSELVAAPFERADWTEKPILLHGPEPAEALIQLRTNAEASVLASLGVPPALVGNGANL